MESKKEAMALRADDPKSGLMTIRFLKNPSYTAVHFDKNKKFYTEYIPGCPVCEMEKRKKHD